MTQQKELFVVIDGNAIVHRAYHALPPLTAKDGTMIHAVYGFTSMLLKVITDLRPTYLAVSFDVSGGTFRDEIFEEYKATRVAADQELYDQIPIVKQVIDAFDIPIYEKKGFEADDIIGSITREICDKHGDTVESMIVTGDMDILQLVDECTRVYELRKGLSDIVIFDREKVREKYGFGPEMVVSYKALRGDPSDNIPGVRGIGDKTAKQLIELVGGIDDIYEDLTRPDSRIRETMKPGVIKKLEGGETDARMSRELATIHRNVKGVRFSLEKTRFQVIDGDAIRALFTELEFSSLLKRVPGMAEKKTQKKKKNTRRNTTVTVVDGVTLDALILTLAEHREIVLRSSPLAANALLSGELPSIVITVSDRHYFVDLKTLTEPQLGELLDAMGSEDHIIIGHDLKSIVRLFLLHGGQVYARLFDTMIGSFVVSSSSRHHDLRSVVARELRVDLPTESDQGTLFGVDPQVLAREGELVRDLYDHFKSALVDVAAETLFYDIEMPVMKLLALMENLGVSIDKQAMATFSSQIERRIVTLTRHIQADAGEEFNVASAGQLRKVLFEELALPTAGIKKGKTGYSTAASELEKLRGKHPIIEKIEEYREITKLQNTYVDVLPRLIHSSTGRIHTTFNQAIASTGRLSSSHPNLQNIPIRTDLGREVRNMFIAAKGYRLVAVDYSQIELRVVAHLAQDRKLREIFRNGEDVHTATASLISGVEMPEVTTAMRRKAKEVNFGVLYGMGAYGLSARTKISQPEAKAFIDRYFEEFSGVRTYLDGVIEEARTSGYVETLYGRRRYIPELRSENYQLRAAGERMAINLPVQGTAAEIMKLAMIAVCKRLGDESLGCDQDIRMILQVHDEIVFEVKKGLEDSVTRMIIEEMESVIPLSVPLDAAAKVGHRWGDLEDFMT